jgi:uncharacterized membrane protein HdeD (DUF308 family)
MKGLFNCFFDQLCYDEDPLFQLIRKWWSSILRVFKCVLGNDIACNEPSGVVYIVGVLIGVIIIFLAEVLICTVLWYLWNHGWNHFKRTLIFLKNKIRK